MTRRMEGRRVLMTGVSRGIGFEATRLLLGESAEVLGVARDPERLEGRVAVNSLSPGWLKTDLGGPEAPGEPRDGGVRILELLGKPFSETGKFWYGAEQIEF